MPFLKKYKVCPSWKEKENTSLKSGLRNTMFFLNGDKHAGQWSNNLKQGKGSEETHSGYLYEGDFYHQLRHGHGVLSKKQNDGTYTLVYNGEWAYGTRHGYGIQHSRDGSWYDGFWCQGYRTGEGRAWLPDGSFYQGHWLNDKFEGLGILVFPNGNFYEGQFSNGMKHGKGRFFHLESLKLQEGVWNEDICACSTVVDMNQIPNHPIPRNELQSLESVITTREEALLKTQSEGSSEQTEIYSFP